VQNNNAQTMPSLRSSSGADLKVKPMLGLFREILSGKIYDF